MSFTWSGLTSGITRGTSFTIRSALEFDTTAQPASANRGSSSRAIPESSAAKMVLGAPSGRAGETTMLATFLGMAVFSRHLAASPYGLPSERSEAASHTASNQGWCSSIWINRWPTMPVAPRTPTGILFDINEGVSTILQHRSLWLGCVFGQKGVFIQGPKTFLFCVHAPSAPHDPQTCHHRN